LESQGDRVLIHVPVKGPDPVVSVVALQIEGEPVSTYNSVVLNKPVTASANQESARFINDDDGGSRWRNTTTTGSFEIDLGAPRSFATLRIAPYEDMKEFTLEAKVGDTWKTILQGKSLRRDENILTFTPVTTQVVRFSFKDEPKAPQICDFELYPEL
jgi:hypothetical protein